MNLSKKILMDSFFKSQFSYCPMVWMSHSRTINNKINHLHERCLGVTYNDKISSFKELLEGDGSVPIHNRNLQILATEIFEVYNNIAPPILMEIFNKRNPNDQLRHTSHFSIPPVRRVYNGTQSLSFLGPKVWDIVLTELKEVKTQTLLNQELRIGGHKTVHAGYVSDICQILVLYNVGPYV